MNKSKIMKALPTVLFISGIAGIFVSEVMASRDTLKAEKVLKDKVKVKMADDDKPEPYADNAATVILCSSKPEYVKNIVKATWKCYIPTFCSTSITLAALIASNRLTAKQIALLSSAVAGAGSLITRYRDKIKDYANEDILNEIDREVAKEEIVKAKPPVVTTSHLLSSERYDPNEEGEFLFFDPFTKMRFRTTKLNIMGAKYFINRNFAMGGCVPLSMFYEFLGLTLPDEYNYCEWDCSQMEDDGYYWIDIDLVKSTEPDPDTGELYYILEYGFYPGEVEESIYPAGNPMDIGGSHV